MSKKSWVEKQMNTYVSKGPICCNEVMKLVYSSHRGSRWTCRRCGQDKSRDW